MSRIAQLDLSARGSLDRAAWTGVRMAHVACMRPFAVGTTHARVAIRRVCKHAPPD